MNKLVTEKHKKTKISGATSVSICGDMPLDNACILQIASHRYSYLLLAYKQNIYEQGM